MVSGHMMYREMRALEKIFSSSHAIDGDFELENEREWSFESVGEKQLSSGCL